MTIDQARYGPFGDEFGPAWEMSTRRLRMRSAPAEAHPVGSGDANVVAGSVRAAWPVAAAMRPGQCLRRQKGAYRFAACCVSLCGAVSERGRRLCLSGYECLWPVEKVWGLTVAGSRNLEPERSRSEFVRSLDRALFRSRVKVQRKEYER